MEKAINRVAIALSIFLVLSLVGAQVNYVRANPIPTSLPSITISSDGSIQGSLSPLPISRNGNVYTLIGNISGYGLDIQCSSIVLEGQGNSLQASAEFNVNSGITIGGSGVTVENVTISQYYIGIDVEGSSNTISWSNISAYDNGINVAGQANLITENQISNCGGSGLDLSGSTNKINANNINCSSGCCITVNSDYNTINGNLLIGCFDVWLYGNSNNVSSNTITGSNGIIFFDPATSNTVDKNQIENNNEGIGLDKQVNTFYLNNFVNNTYNVRLHTFSDPYAPYSMNVFDNGSVGNYWSDFNAKYPAASEIGNTGIYNTPYVIDGNITDRYPLTTPYNIGHTGVQSPFSIEMPVEYVNYTVSQINGTLWATVDGTFPMQIPRDWVDQELPMLYPMPPGVTNISIALNGQQVSWSNYTQAYPDALHYTYLGNWSMITYTIQPKQTNFTLTIHYQHPISQANGTYLFLYDLNISPYLSDQSNSSVAHFAVHFETGCSNIRVYTVPGDSSTPRDQTKTPVNFTINKTNGTQTIAFNITSSLTKPVPGDELVTFRTTQDQVTEFGPLLLILLSIVVGLALVVVIVTISKRRKDPYNEPSNQRSGLTH